MVRRLRRHSGSAQLLHGGAFGVENFFKQTWNQTFSIEYLQASIEEVDEKFVVVNDYDHVDMEPPT